MLKLMKCCVLFQLLTLNFLFAGSLTTSDSVKLLLLEDLRSGRAKKGAQVKFKVDEDLVDRDGNLLIRKGTPAYGKVVRSRKAGAWGRRGIIEVEVDYTHTIDNQRVELRANETKAGSKNKRLITSGAWLVAWPLAFVRGKNVVIKSGTTIVAWIDSALKVHSNIKITPMVQKKEISSNDDYIYNKNGEKIGRRVANGSGYRYYDLNGKRISISKLEDLKK